MTKEDRELLFKDLCGRLPYGVKIFVPVFKHIETLEGLENFDEQITINGNVSNIKPYLRPMSSMTEDEKFEYSNLCFEEEREEFVFGEWATKTYYHDTIQSIDWLNSHHFDYRGLIEKGLALEAPEGMYETIENK